MDKVIKINSRQGGPFSATNNLVDFDIAPDGTYDLTDSYINLVCRITGVGENASAAAANKTGGMYPLRVALGKDPRAAYNVAMVKNCSISSELQGQLEDIRRVDVLRSNLNEYTLSNEQKNSDGYKSIRQLQTRNNQYVNLFQEIHKSGEVNSRMVNARIPIPFSQLFELGRLTQYPAQAMGKTRVHLELNIDKLQVLEGANAAGIDVTISTNWVALSNNTAAAVAIAQLVGTNPVREDDFPYFVGQTVKVSGTVAAAPVGPPNQNGPQSGYGIITSIEWSATSVPTVNFSGDLSYQIPAAAAPGAATPATFSAIVIEPLDAVLTNAKIEICQAEIVLRRLSNAVKPPSQLNYMTWSTEEYTTDAQLNFQRMFQLEPEAVNVLLMFPDPSNGGDILSNHSHAQSFRMRLNNDDLTDRDIKLYQGNGFSAVHDPLHYDRLNMTLQNAGYPLGCLQEQNLDATEQPNTNANYPLLIVGNPVPQTQNEKLLQFNMISATTGLSRLNLYKQCMRSIKV